jgi:hypothetical protein
MEVACEPCRAATTFMDKGAKVTEPKPMQAFCVGDGRGDGYRTRKGARNE